MLEAIIITRSDTIHRVFASCNFISDHALVTAIRLDMSRLDGIGSGQLAERGVISPDNFDLAESRLCSDLQSLDNKSVDELADLYTTTR